MGRSVGVGYLQRELDGAKEFLLVAAEESAGSAGLLSAAGLAREKQRSCSLPNTVKAAADARRELVNP